MKLLLLFVSVHCACAFSQFVRKLENKKPINLDGFQYGNNVYNEEYPYSKGKSSFFHLMIKAEAFENGK